MKKVWIVRGIAIRPMWSGLFRITSPWKEKRRTRVRRSPTMVTGASRARKTFVNHSMPRVRTSQLRTSTPAARGITM
jgi:hypothetical protein